MSEPKLLARRHLLALLGGSALAGLRSAKASPLALPLDGLGFSVWRDGSEIGTHTVGFERDGERTVVRSVADFTVRFGPITLYRYTYRVSETWQGDRLETIWARTDDNGTADFADAQREGDQLVVIGSKSGRYVAPPGAIAATHWNDAELSQAMINPQNGELMRFERRELGREQLASGVTARHVALSGHAVLDLWYDESRQWCALRAVASDGSIIDYRPR